MLTCMTLLWAGLTGELKATSGVLLMLTCMAFLWAGLIGELEATSGVLLMLTCLTLLWAGLTGDLEATSGVSLMLTCMAFFVVRVDRRAGSRRALTYVDMHDFVVGRVDGRAQGN